MYKNNVNSDAVKSSKQDYRKMLGKTIEFKKKIKLIEKEIDKDIGLLDGKKERLRTLKKLNKTLKRKHHERLQLEDRYNELGE